MQPREPLSAPMHPAGRIPEICWREVMQVAFDGRCPGADGGGASRPTGEKMVSATASEKRPLEQDRPRRGERAYDARDLIPGGETATIALDGQNYTLQLLEPAS